MVQHIPKTLAYTLGNADITFNVQTVPEGRVVNGSISCGLMGLRNPGCCQTRSFLTTCISLLPMTLPIRIKVMDLMIWTSSRPVNGPRADVEGAGQSQRWPGGNYTVLSHCRDRCQSRCLTIAWYDTRAGSTNAAGHFLLDVFLRSSRNGGLTFGPEVQLNDVPFDPTWVRAAASARNRRARATARPSRRCGLANTTG